MELNWSKKKKWCKDSHIPILIITEIRLEMHCSEVKKKSKINIYKLNNAVDINNAHFLCLKCSTSCLTICSSFLFYSLPILNTV